MSLYKKAQRWSDDRWVDIEFEDIKEGDKVMLTGSDGVKLVTADSDAVPCEPPGNYSFQARRPNEPPPGFTEEKA